MKNRERILELVSKGVLSVEEGLDLLESLSERETKRTAERDFTFDEVKVEEKTEEISHEEYEETDPAEETVEQTKEEASEIEEELENLANQINQYSVGIDILNQELASLNAELIEIEAELVRKKQLNEQKESTRLENKVVALSEEIEELTTEKNNRMKAMHSLKMKRWTSKAKQLSGNIDLPEDWRAGASETIDKAGELLDSGSQRLAELLEVSVKKTKEAFDSIDWQDLKIDFPGKEKASFEHEWLFEETTASILDFKNARGNIQFKPSMNDNIKVSAEIKLYGKIEEASPLEAFKARTVIAIDEDHFKFKIPNKNIKADLVVYLPQRNYDYIRLNTLSGDIQFEEILARDIYVKVTTGDVTFKQIEASMLEIEAVNGDVTLENTELRDLLLSTANGEVRIDGAIQSLETSTVNGDLRITLSGEKLMRVIARAVNGDVKLSLPEEQSIEIEAKTTMGSIESRLSGVKTSQDKKAKGQSQCFYRVVEGDLCRGSLQTTRGNILLKDTTKNTEETGE